MNYPLRLPWLRIAGAAVGLLVSLELGATTVRAQGCPSLDPLDDGSGPSGAVSLPDLVLAEISPGQYITVYNTTSADIVLAAGSHWLTSGFSFASLASLGPAVTVSAGGFAALPWPMFFSGASSDADGEIVLYLNSQFAVSQNILDFTCWGTNPPLTWKLQAESVGKWAGICNAALSAGALRRLVSTTGTGAADYDTNGVPQCGPAICGPFGGDPDGDGICSDGNGSGTSGDAPCGDLQTTGCDDSCPTIENPAQKNSDGLPAGDACQCMDVNGDGRVDVLDWAFTSRHVAGRFPPESFDVGRCSVVAPVSCGPEDVDQARQYLARLVTTLAQDCLGICGDGVLSVGENCDPPDDSACPGGCQDDCSCCTDQDSDGFCAEAADCNDSDGSIFPGAPERCNGRDDDCDLLVDEDFDADQDGASPCSPDPMTRDCDDGDPGVSPGSLEMCGAEGTGNGTDENCNGYVDEACTPCNPSDTDGDGVSACEGDCAPEDSDVYPGRTEICDGRDTDCHLGTVVSCNRGDPCNWPGDLDVCRDDLSCVCTVAVDGSCTGSYVCQDYCNTSGTGLPGDGCASDQTCFYSLSRSADIHICATVTEPAGSKLGGVPCTGNSECRSLNCDRIFTGPGSVRVCIDHCGGDAYCPEAGTICYLRRLGTDFESVCAPSTLPRIGVKSLGEACTTDSECDHGFCSETTGTCSQRCCSGASCPPSFLCAFDADFMDTGFPYIASNAASCSEDSECATGFCFTGSNRCAHLLVETAGQCVPDLALTGDRTAGAACTQNADCRSRFCDDSLGVCVQPCCNAGDCPMGLSCRLQFVQTRAPLSGEPARATNARICVSTTQDSVWRRKLN